MLSYPYMDVNLAIFSFLIFIFSVVLHEVAHGYAAERLGDPTARLAGRLTLNPISHIDPVGSVLLPLILYISHAGFIIGWAKPVPFNPYNLRSKKWGEAIVAAAGPATNLLIALVFGLFLHFGPISTISSSVVLLISTIVLINLVLAVFNLVPIPPLDGSKILFSIFPAGFSPVRAFLEKYSLILALIFIFFLWQYISPLVYLLFTLITGINS
jgi:Zn-dependent protease